MAPNPHSPTTGDPPVRRVRHINGFLVILLLTAAVWLVLSMSDYRDYPLQARVAMTGYDTHRFAVLDRDSTLALQVQANGFSALALGLRRQPVILTLDMSADIVRHHSQTTPGNPAGHHCRAVALADCSETLRTQLARRGVRNVSTSRDSLRLTLVPRASKTLPVSIAPLQIAFADGYGLYGQPTVTPSEITLYGPQQALDRITELPVCHMVLSGIAAGGAHSVPLEPVWQSLGDVSPSADKVLVDLPVEPYVERTYTLPVALPGIDTTLRLHLYPDRVSLQVWIARRDIASVSARSFEVTADPADILAGNPHLTPRLARFPDHVRVKSLSPSEIQYVIIK